MWKLRKERWPDVLYYYMAKPFLGKSLCSDWFFLRQDFAVQILFWSEAGKFKICNQNSEEKKATEYCHSSQWIYQKKLKRLKFFRNFKDGWRRRTFSKRVLLSLRSGNFWCRNWNRHHRRPYNNQLTNRACSGCTGEYCPEVVATRTERSGL